ncbi:uncharacterized protein LOC120835556 isoform X2 [Gasterosteus aculeatus]
MQINLGSCHWRRRSLVILTVLIIVLMAFCVFLSKKIDTGSLPTRKANLTLKISITFLKAFKNLSSTQSLEFIKTLERELKALCKEADPRSFKKVRIIKLTPGSVVADSVAEYIYLNNETQIQFVNTQLDGVLTDILNNTSNLNRISRAFNNSDVLLNGLAFQTPEIRNITDLEPFANCTQFNYTAEVVKGQWQCAGPCKRYPGYCHQHGICNNDVQKGATCRCSNSSLQQFYGVTCESFSWGPGFYIALFGSLAAALLLIIIIIVIVRVRKRHTGTWRMSNYYDSRLSDCEVDLFHFSAKDPDFYDFKTLTHE